MNQTEDLDVIRRERIIAFSLLCFLIASSALDIFEDLEKGSSAGHVGGECAIITMCTAAAIYLWRRVVRGWTNETAGIRSQLATIRDDAKRWEAAHATLSQGLTRAIEEQLHDWGLSSAEKEITLLLMKGLSFKEIAEVRKTSEQTVRQQAATIYRKSGLEGRNQLTAFFLEDLLTPRL